MLKFPVWEQNITSRKKKERKKENEPGKQPFAHERKAYKART